MSFLTGKKALIVGLISNRSIAYGIAQALHQQGAELAFTYQDERFKARIGDMASAFNSQLLFPCDLAHDNQIENVFTELAKHWDGLDIIIHSAAFAPAEELQGDF